MTAAAAAAKAAQQVAGEVADGTQRLIGLALVVAAGLVEGVALGGLQAAGLSRMLPALDRRRWLVVTVLVAGLGWAAASAPAALSGSEDGAAPPLALMLGGAGALGAVMGAVLGAAQSGGLVGHVRHARRWIGANIAAWTPAMMIIFAGATAPDSDTSAAAVVGLGAVTGLVAGAVVGVVTGWFLRALDES